jgi:hypothetical protein
MMRSRRRGSVDSNSFMSLQPASRFVEQWFDLLSRYGFPSRAIDSEEHAEAGRGISSSGSGD